MDNLFNTVNINGVTPAPAAETSAISFVPEYKTLTPGIYNFEHKGKNYVLIFKDISNIKLGEYVDGYVFDVNIDEATFINKDTYLVYLLCEENKLDIEAYDMWSEPLYMAGDYEPMWVYDYTEYSLPADAPLWLSGGYAVYNFILGSYLQDEGLVDSDNWADCSRLGWEARCDGWQCVQKSDRMTIMIWWG